MNDSRLVYSTETGRICPECGKHYWMRSGNTDTPQNSRAVKTQRSDEWGRPPGLITEKTDASLYVFKRRKRKGGLWL